ncbi:MAG: hypothetical protein GY866_22600 [Proteobacteria bacterium]|nr:hypothetical protein [Pseudomonadota bacterium]
MGFGRACNLAFERFPGDHILLLNPDAGLLPACLRHMQKTMLSGKNVAAVGPRVFWDEVLQSYLPPSCPPCYFLYAPALAGLSPGSSFKRLLSAMWRSHAVKLWHAGDPVRVGNLSGGHVLVKREAVHRAGGLFDPRFFMYFEDTDLFMRLRKAGGDLIFEPRAEVIHQYDRCGQDETALKRRFAEDTHELFMRKHLIGCKPAVSRFLKLFTACFPNKPDREPSADYHAPFSIHAPELIRDDWLFEWSPNPDFIPAAGRFGRGEVMDFSETHWSMLAPGQYFGRLGRADGSNRHFRQISWKKHGTKEE